MNVYGFINKTRTLPSGAILDNQFPGHAHGTHAARLAHLFCSEIFSLADYCIDLQTGALNHSNLPQTYVTDGNANELELAQAFAAPVVSEINPQKGTLRTHANKNNIPYIMYEAGEAMRFDESSIRIGKKGILNVMRQIDMLPASAKSQPTQPQSIVTQDTRWVRAPTSGISHTTIKLGQQVKQGERLATINDPFGAGSDVHVSAPFDGIVVGINNLPLVHEGVSLFELAAFEKLSLAATHIEDWMDESESAA